MTARRATNKGAPAPVEAFKQQRRRFHRARQSRRSRRGDERARRRQPARARAPASAQIEARDREIDNPYVKDAQVMNIHNARALYRRPADPHRDAAPDSRSRARPADRRQAQHPDPQDAGRLRDRSRLAACSAATARSCRGSTPPARSPASAAAACTAIARWKAPSSAAACFRAAMPGGRRRRRWGETDFRFKLSKTTPCKVECALKTQRK